MSNHTGTIVQTIREWIDAGRLNPGDEIEEAALIEPFGVSRTPVREGLLGLETMGLVRRMPRRGAVVFKPTLEEFLAILEVHAQLEGQAAGLAARRLSPAGAARPEAAVSACEAHAMDFGDANPGDYYQLNLGFHGTVADASGNPFLDDMIKTDARKLMACYRARYGFAGAIDASAREHRDIATRIGARDAAGAEALMRRHVQFDQFAARDLLATLG